MTFESINEVCIKWRKDIDNAILGEIKQKAIENGIKTEYVLNEEAIISALEKQIPRKVEILTYQPLINSGWKHRCPNCGCAVGINKNLGFAYEEYLEPNESYCCSCGQALDWSDTE